MDTLINKLRGIFSGTEEENKADQGGSRDQKIPIPKKEKTKAPNWLQRQISRKMSRDYDSMEYATAVAAAAFAISSQEVPEIPDERKTSDPSKTSLTKTKSKVDGTKSPSSIPRAISKTLSGSFRSTGDQGNKMPTSSSVAEEKKPEKTITPAPSMKKASTFSEKTNKTGDVKKPETPAPKRTPTFGDKNLVNTDDIKPDTPAPRVPPPLRSPLLPPPPPPPPPITQTYDRKADAWERNQLQKIKERYDKLMETIDTWEKRKAMKARRKLNKHEQSENERKRVKAWRKYEEKRKYIDEIAEGARAERRRKEELKAKAKANRIRTTGELPRSCPCF